MSTSSQTKPGRGVSLFPSPPSPKLLPTVLPSVFLLMAGDEMFHWLSRGKVRSALTRIPDGLLEGSLTEIRASLLWQWGTWQGTVGDQEGDG